MTLTIIIGVVVLLIAALAIGGYVATTRRYDAEEVELRAQAQQADQHLARAHAEDKGWERTALEAAARGAYAERHPGREPQRLLLVQVVDRPGTDEDEAVFDVDGERLVLGRRAGAWFLAG
jgi:Tfp pilus assembly protein PilV